jgi:DNA-directed RNA polymerase subunit RPC12/RpoP
MAHWIIDDHGFGGTYYTCSECGEIYWDILDHGCGGDTCIRCGSPMDEDETVYMKNGRVEE